MSGDELSVRLRRPQHRWTMSAPLLLAAGAVLGWRSLSGNNDRHWLLVARDSSYAIWLDTTRIGRVNDRVYEVWYRTDHSQARYYRDQAFDRETVQIQITCRLPGFKVVSTTLSARGKGDVIHQENTSKDVQGQPWRAVEPGSTDADAAETTCSIADSRWLGL